MAGGVDFLLLTQLRELNIFVAQGPKDGSLVLRPAKEEVYGPMTRSIPDGLDADPERPHAGHGLTYTTALPRPDLAQSVRKQA